MSSKSHIGATLAALVLAVSPAAGQVAPGSRLTVSGTADATDVGSAGVVLYFGHRVVVDREGNTGAFASFNRSSGTGLSGALRDLTVGAGPQRVANFFTIGGYRFDVMSLESGPYGQDECYVDPMIGQRCTPYQSPGFTLSPFYLANEASGDPESPILGVVSFDVLGEVTGPRGLRSRFVGTVTSVFPASFQEALFTLEQEGLQDVPFRATFLTIPGDVTGPAGGVVTPEPSSVALLATGLGAVAFVRRRRARRTR